MKTKLLLKAAQIVEKVDPTRFNMSSVSCCILGHCAKSDFEEFKILTPLLVHGSLADWEPLAVECFGISEETANNLFGVCGGRKNSELTPKEAAAKIRRVVAAHQKKLARQKDERVAKRAIRLDTRPGVAAVKAAVKKALTGEPVT
jgi:hypothetical protein